jgi:hypothetical protein
MLNAAKSGHRYRMRMAMLAVVTGLGALSGCVGATGGSTTTMPESSAPPPAVSTPSRSVPLETLSSQRLSPVYWLGERDATVYLYREYLSAEDQGDPVTTALKYMTEHRPTDPDFFNLWSPASRIGTSVGSDNVITVDLSADAFARKVDAGLAERAIQQLVYTATAAAANSGLLAPAPAARVDILVDGHTGFEAFGHVKLTGPISRTASLRAPIWIIVPQQDTEHPAGRVNVHGISQKFPGGTHWELSVRNDDGSLAVDSSGTAEPGAGTLGPGEYSVDLTLEPGDYRIAVWGIGADGSTRLSEDTKDFSVTSG